MTVPMIVRDADCIAREINEIKSSVRAAIGNGFMAIGQKLLEAKELVPHGEWARWLRTNVDYSQRTADNLMRVAREYANWQPDSNLTYSNALILLALPAPLREEFAAGTDLSVMSKRDLECAVRELRADRAVLHARIEELRPDAARMQRQDEMRARAAKRRACTSEPVPDDCDDEPHSPGRRLAQAYDVVAHAVDELAHTLSSLQDDVDMDLLAAYGRTYADGLRRQCCKLTEVCKAEAEV